MERSGQALRTMMRQMIDAGDAASGIGAVEALEDRRLLSSVSFQDGVLRVVGDSSAANNMSAWYSSGSKAVKGWTGKDGEIVVAPVSQLKKVELIGGSKNDRFYVDKLVNVPVYIAKNGGTDTVVGGNSRITYLNSTPTPTPTPSPTPEKPPLSDSDSPILIGGDEYSDDTGEAGAPVAAISASSTGGMAGHTVHVNGLGSNLRVGNPLTARYEWDFGDPAGDHNQMVGYNAAHTYDKAGVYTVTLFVTNESGRTASARTRITIDADTRKMVYVDREGSDSNDGSSSSRAVQSLGRVKQLLGDDTRVLFQRGDTWNMTASLNVPYDNVIVGAYGTGSAPVLKWTSSSVSDMVGLSGSNSRNVIIQDLTLDSSGARPIGVRPRGENVTIRNNQFGRLLDAINANGSPDGMLIENNSVPTSKSVSNYFGWIAGSDITIAGNKIEPVGLHTIRMNEFSRVNVSDNTIRNTTRSGIGAQRGDFVTIANNDITGTTPSGKAVTGSINVGPLGGGDGTQDATYTQARTRYAVIENNVIDDTNLAVHDGSEHVAIRNNVIKIGDGVAIQVDGYDSTYKRGVDDVQIINNTGINDASNGKFLHIYGSATNVTLKNNLYVAPSMTTGLNGNAVVYVAGSDLDCFKEVSNNVWADVNKHWYAQGGLFYVWKSWSDQRGYLTLSEWDVYTVVSDERVANVSLNSAFAPSSSSAAANAAEKYAGVFTDINGKVRPTGGAWTAGAVQL